MRERRGSIPEELKSQDSSGVSSTDCADHADSQRCQFGKFSWPTLRHGFSRTWPQCLETTEEVFIDAF